MNHPPKFRTRNWVEINDKSRGDYDDDDSNNVDNNKFKTTMISSSLCDYSVAYILVKGTITVSNTANDDGAAVNNTNRK